MTESEFFNAITAELEMLEIPSDYAKTKLDQIKARVEKLEKNDAEKFFCSENHRAVIEKIRESYENDFKSNNTMTLTRTFDDVSEKDNTDDNTKNNTENEKEPKITTVVTPTDLPKAEKKGNFFVTVLEKMKISVDPEKRDSSLMLWALLIIFAPLVLTLFLGSSLGFLAVFVALAAAIIGIIGVIFVVVLGGAVLSVASLLYGVSQLLGDTKYIGVHEVGLGLIFVGATMLVGISLYNVAVRLIPWLYRMFGKLFVWLCKMLKKAALAVSKGCEKL